MYKILVPDCNSRKALCAIRSLGKRGFHVIAGSSQKINISRFSKYCSEFHQFSDPITNSSVFISELDQYVKLNNIDILLPMEDETVELIIKNIEMFNTAKTLLPDIDTFMKARDKGETLLHTIDLGISCPKTYFINSLEELELLEQDIVYPVILKPRISSGSRGIIVVENKEELMSKYLEIHKNYSFPIIQQYISSKCRKIQTLFILDDKHEVKGSCTYEGIREFPVNGGPVTLWKTVSYPEIENASSEILKSLKWIGFAEIEYLVDDNTGEFYLMEINPRFSANIALAVNVGVDFPFFTAKILLGEKFEKVINNRFEEYCQWLLPGDLLNFIFNKNRFKQKIGYFFNKPKKLSYAILSFDDPMPVLGTVLAMIFNFGKNIKDLKVKLKVSKN
jgi:predicted ATP-grasp superfamily ATP-dependent carboligase